MRSIHTPSIFLLFFMCVACSGVTPVTFRADEAPSETKTVPSSGESFSPIVFYQKIISKADGDRCASFPSCSHYARSAIKKHGFLTGWILTCDRLLRCGRDEKAFSPIVRVSGALRVYDPVNANTSWWKHP